jgi:hypothetical protein
MVSMWLWWVMGIHGEALGSYDMCRGFLRGVNGFTWKTRGFKWSARAAWHTNCFHESIFIFFSIGLFQVAHNVGETRFNHLFI